MSKPCTVIIGALELLDALRDSAGEDNDVLTFSDNEPLKALEAITTRRPTVIALERLFAATSRGAALINRIKADPTLGNVEIRVASVDGTYRVSRRRTPVRSIPTEPVVPTAPPGAPVRSVGDIAMETVEIVEPALPVEGHPPPQNLDYRGTRRAPRVRMAEGTEAQVDGALVKVVDLSTIGAQILCPIPLKPQQQVRMVLADDLGLVKFSATVAWAFFEIPKGVSHYRAGVEFKDAEPKAVDAFGKRHKS
jgi:hypothetical protein